jgi:hypothetical protein
MPSGRELVDEYRSFYAPRSIALATILNDNAKRDESSS